MNDRPGWVPCPTCGGSGTVTDPRATEREWLLGLREVQCPDCSSGWVPSDGLVEVATAALTESRPGLVGEIEWAAASHFARRALIAADRYEREQALP